jgi:glyoxylase I family protein
MTSQAHSGESQVLVADSGAIRYQVTDVSRAVAFYTQRLGFKLDQPNGGRFGQVSLGGLKLILSGPGASGPRTLPNGCKQEPGDWNRVVLHVEDLTSQVETMKQAGTRFKNEIVLRPGGKQIQLEDPDGNPIELFEPCLALNDLSPAGKSDWQSFSEWLVAFIFADALVAVILGMGYLLLRN